MGWGRGIFEPIFISLSNSLYEFFLGRSMNIFLALIGGLAFAFKVLVNVSLRRRLHTARKDFSRNDH